MKKIINYINISKKGKKSNTNKEFMKDILSDKFIITVKVGPKGQITIPKEAREMFNIEVGDILAILGDKAKGITIIKAEEIYKKVGM